MHDEARMMSEYGGSSQLEVTHSLHDFPPLIHTTIFIPLDLWVPLKDRKGTRCGKERWRNIIIYVFDGRNTIIPDIPPTHHFVPTLTEAFHSNSVD